MNGANKMIELFVSLQRQLKPKDDEKEECKSAIHDGRLRESHQTSRQRGGIAAYKRIQSCHQSTHIQKGL